MSFQKTTTDFVPKALVEIESNRIEYHMATVAGDFRHRIPTFNIKVYVMVDGFCMLYLRITAK